MSMIDRETHPSNKTAQAQADQTFLSQGQFLPFDRWNNQLTQDALQRRVFLKSLRPESTMSLGL